MVVKNKYVKRSHISEQKFRQIVKLFAEDLNATQISHLTGISRPAINKYLKAIRKRIAAICEPNPPLKGEIEVDESYFGAKRAKGKHGRGAYGKTIVFGLLKKRRQGLYRNCARYQSCYAAGAYTGSCRH